MIRGHAALTRIVRLGLAGALLASAAAAQTTPSVKDLYRPGEERVWVFEQDKQRIGYSTFRYEGTVELAGLSVQRFTGSVRIDAMPAMGLPEQRYLGELFTDDAGRPLRSVLEVTLGDAYSRVELALAGGKAEALIEQGRAPKKLSVDAPAGVQLQANNFIGYFELMLALTPPAPDGVIESKLLSINVLKVFPYRAVPIAKAAEAAVGEGAGAKYEDSLGETVTIAGRRVVAIDVATQKLVIAQSDERPQPFTIERPKPAAVEAMYDVEQVAIRHGDVSLAGEITRPKGAQGRLPAVFFVSGSGLQDRDGEAQGLDLGTHEILDRLTQAGFLVLRVDDRGAGGSTGPVDDLGNDDLIADARACADFLFARDDVDPGRVALIGHSEGGITVPILAVERPRIAAVVLMAATARSIAEVILEQNGQALDLAGVKGEERAKVLAEVRRYLELASSDAKIDPETVPADYRALLSMRAWLRGHARQDPLANIRRVKCPVLVLQGAKDFQVSPDRDARALAKALDEAGNADHELIVFPGLDHLFKKAPGETSQLSDYFLRRSIDAAFLDALVAWLSKRLRVEQAR